MKQIEVYDNKIEKSKKKLLAEVEKKNIELDKSSIKHDDSSSKQSNPSVFEKVVNYDSNHALVKYSQHLTLSDKITWTDGKQFFYPNSTSQIGNNDLKSLKIAHELQQQNFLTPKEHFSSDPNNSNLVVDYNKLRKQLFQSLETNYVCETVPLKNESTTVGVNNLKDSQDILSDSQPLKISNHTSNNLRENLKNEIFFCKMNDVNINSEVPFCEHSISLKDMSNTKNNQELHLEKNTDILNLTTSCSNTNNDSSTSSSTSSNIQRASNENVHNLSKEKEDNVSQFDMLINEPDDYSPGFTSDENTPEFQELYEINMHNSIIESQVTEDDESSYEEERSEGDIMFEDKTFIEQYSDYSDLVNINYKLCK